MTSTTDILQGDTDPGTVDRDISPPSPSGTRLVSRGRRALPWAALAVAAITTVILAVSVSMDDNAVQPANRAALRRDAEQYVEWLERRAASIPNANRAALRRQADQYVEWLESRAASIAEGESSTDGFVPGNLPALERQAEQYVEWLESRAASVAEGESSTDGFVPADQHPPTP